MKLTFTKTLSLAAAALTLVSAVLPTVASAQAEDIKPSVEHEGTPIAGGTFRYALVGDAFKGALSPLYASDSQDQDIIALFSPGLYGNNENFEIDDSGFAKIEFDKENKKVKITIPKDQKWDDGQPLTIDDVIYPYEVIGHKDYKGVRYGEDYQNVVGMEEYHEGKADTISGLNRIDDYTLEITYKEFGNSMLQAGGGVGNYVIPKHIFKDIPVAEQEDSDAVRKNPVGFGPFRVKSITPGEAVEFEANEYYYKGRPKVDAVVLEVVSASTAVQEMKAGNYDYAKLPTDEYETYKDAANLSTVGQVSNAFTYIGFHQGKWNEEKGEVEVDESKLVSNQSLRQAMGYAIDNDLVTKEFYKGLRFRANTTIPSMFKDYNASDIVGFDYQPEKAKQILADAGFKDSNGDGYVEDPEGNEFTLQFISMSGGNVAEPIAQYYIDAWKEVGIHVELKDGRLMEFNTFYEELKTDGEFDVYQAAFGTGGDPNPSGLFGRDAAFNYTRWASEKNDQLLADIQSDKSFDKEFRTQAFRAWQENMTEEAPVIPTMFRYQLETLNKRVKFYDGALGSKFGLHELELTAEEPIKE